MAPREKMLQAKLLLVFVAISAAACATTQSEGQRDQTSPIDRASPGERRPVDAPGPAADAALPDAAVLGSVRVGVLSDLHGLPEDRLAALVTALQQQGAQCLGVLGDLIGGAGTEEQQLTRALGVIAQPKLPVFVIAGNSESHQPYARALKAVTAAHPHVADLSPYGATNCAGVPLVALAGYHLSRWLPADGFRYGQAELDAVAALAKARGARVLLTHGPPRSQGPQGIDAVTSGSNVGDAALNALLDAQGIAFAAAGHIHEAGQRAVTAANAAVPAGSWSQNLRLNAAAAQDGKASILELRGDEARFATVQLAP